MLEERNCLVCGSEQWFEVPVCADGHGQECPERVCTGCGSALVLAHEVPRATTAGRARLAVVA